MEEKIINIVLRYIEEKKGTKFKDTNYINIHFTYDGVLKLVITPTYLQVYDTSTHFSIIVHSNKNLIKVNYRYEEIHQSIYKSEYSYIDILYKLSLIDNTNMVYYPREMEDEVTQHLKIHNRNIIIDGILE
jgi:hypothetical protein